MASLTDYIVDTNGDGFPDDVAARLVVNPPGGTADRAFWSALIDLAARAGLETHALPMPLAIPPDRAADLPDGVDTLDVRTVEDIRELTQDFDGEQFDLQQVEHVPSACLTRLFTVDGVLVDRDGDLLPDGTGFHFNLPDELPAPVGTALANLAARVGLESGGLTMPLTGGNGPAFTVRPGQGEATLRSVQGGWLAEGDPAGLAELLEQVASSWPHIGAPETGGAGWSRDWLRRSLAGDGPEPNQPGAVLWELQWSARWEVDRLLDRFRSTVLPRLHPNLPVTLTVFASEPREQRRRLESALRHELAAHGIPDAEITVLCAFKAGLSWLREVVIPGLEGLDIASAQISYQRYEPDTAGSAEPLDMQIRWLQELFPGDDLIARETGLPLDAIRMLEVPADPAAPIYRAEAFDRTRQRIGRWECSPLSRIQPFIQQFPDEGTVCVTTGGFIAEQAGNQITCPVETDLERFWAFWQGEVLDRVIREIERAGGPYAALQPFFGALEVEVWISEPNERLQIREENDSASEALHEDIYFGVLDTLEAYGRLASGEKTTAPGAVIPIVHVAPGQTPHARVKLRAAPPRSLLAYPDVTVRSLRLVEGELELGIKVAADDAGAAGTRLQELAERPLPNGSAVQATVTLGDMSLPIRLPLPALVDGAEQPPQIPPPMDVILHGSVILGQAHALAAFPEVTGWVEDISYEGRPLVALSLAAPVPGRLRSPVKESIFKPTCLIIARHHANEISSTNAAFQLTYLCATDPEWRALLDRLNIVILPYENPDGAALHARLAAIPGAQHWKHHPARYNALGYEFGEAYFDPDTRYGEARARPGIWRRWLPDVLVDNHGVPSHEWVQPFAGFGSPPRFRVSYWAPQALLYGIIGYVEEGDDFPHQRRAAVALRDAVSAAVRDIDIGELNRVYGGSYRYWGQSRLPDRFPGQFHDDMLWHISSSPPDPEGRGFQTRYPKTTVLSWVTEVIDETATGPHLEITARAHLLANRAMLDLMARSAPALRRWRGVDGDRVVVRVGRERPLEVGER